MAVATLPEVTSGAAVTSTDPATEPVPASPRPGPSPVVLGTALAVAAGTMVFAGLLGGVLVVRSATRTWPPKGVELDNYLGTVLVLTALMVAASVQWSVYAARHDDTRNSVIGLVLALALGLAVVNAAWYSLVKAGFGVGDHPFGTLFYGVVGSYLAAVVIGTVAALLTLLRGTGGQLTRRDHGMLAATALWWHFLAVVAVAVWLTVWVLK